MEEQPSRRSDRIEVRKHIELSGQDMTGGEFVEEAYTVLISRHGAKILARREFVQEQEFKIRFLENNKQSLARVVGLINKAPEGNYYGITFLDNAPELWDIEFPPLSEAEKALSRVCMKCLRCHLVEVVYLDEFEAEVYVANKGLSRSCRRCSDVTHWREAQLPTAEAGAATPISTEPETGSAEIEEIPKSNRRKHQRLKLKQTACVRSQEHGEEIVVTENASRGGMSFKSSNRYTAGQQIEVAVPFSNLSMNIFFPALIARLKPGTNEGLYDYGVQYILANRKWPQSK